ncbi:MULTISPECIES: MaoC family dehydratase [Mycobacterium]|uniref:MaoC family dehydratase n=1 Tax=Mycobacterium TaxID=1763 RepID=UPI000F27A1CF|nr:MULTISPECIES: MaoC family dehydratase [Mycobacterium]VAZ69695.1 Beta-methylmalyl-CoA dehydratase [Mycobacterium kansasii]
MSTTDSALLAPTGWFEDFTVGQKIRHARAATIDEVEGAFLSKLVVNTAQAHWNEHLLAGSPLGSGRLVFGLLTASTVFGLAAVDTAEHAVAELGCTALRFRAPVHHGDTIEAFTQVLDTAACTDRDDAGIVVFQHWGRRQDGRVVFEGQRSVLIHRRPTRSQS